MLMRLEVEKQTLDSEKGQGMAEYGLILGLVSIVAVAAFTRTGGIVQALMGTVQGVITALAARL